MGAEFDDYAGRYRELLKDPLRDAFAPSSAFFALRKWLLIREFYRSQKRDTGRDCWLDMGCGTGELLRLGRPYFRDAQGCDVSAAMIAASPDLPIRVQQDDTLPFEDGRFDLVTAVCVFHHVAPPLRPKLIAEISRVVKPGGVVGILEHNPLNPVTQWIVRRSPVDVNAILLTAGLSCRLLRAGGFRVVHREYFLYLPEAVYARASSVERALRRIPFGGQYAVFGRKPAG